MTSLNINSFSCIKSATINLTDINVIIGPQGAGKSVTTKLTYFFIDIMSELPRGPEEQLGIEEHKKILCKRFSDWFPPAAWGKERFTIYFESGSFSLRIMRRIKKGAGSDEVSIKFSQYYEEFYQNAVKSYKAAKKSEASELVVENALSGAYEISYRVRTELVNLLEKELGSEFFFDQTFIPAGRAFFTSIGRLVAGLEQGSSLDPVTLRFARLFASWRDNSFYLIDRLGKDTSEKRSEIMGNLFGGAVSSKREAEYIQMPDGRRVPFGFLSSGQQELLPIWFFIQDLLLRDEIFGRRPRTNMKRRQLIYIEEPEAHLFPAAQSVLLNHLIGTVIGEKNRRSLFLTTHSPYIMTKMNVYIKAGQISRRKKKNTELSNIIDRSCWIRGGQISAWALEDGHLRNIIDPDDGLIDASYLDSVSSAMSEEFNELLELEYSL